MHMQNPPLALESVSNLVFPLTNQQIYHIKWSVA